MQEQQIQQKEFRNYKDGDAQILANIKENYRKMRTNQTVDYVQRMRSKYLTFDKPHTIWEAIDQLDDFVDISDPDISLPNVMHLLQTAEAIREANRPDWMQLVGLIHDLGKVMYRWGADEDGTTLKEQWGMVGDIFVVGCKLPDTCVYPEFNADNTDMQNPKYNTELGMYEANCGIDNVLMAWGHDEYLYQILKNHKGNKLPLEAMVMVRYHSFYPWHKGGSYRQLMKENDYQYLDWVKDFNQYDLYTKSPKVYDINWVKDYYQPIIEKYLGKEPVYF